MIKQFPRKRFEEIFRAEALRGERIHWTLHWFLYGMVFVLAGLVYFLQGRSVGLYGMLLAVVNLVYNGALTWPISHARVYPWLRYVTVSLNVITLTIYTYFDGIQNSTLAPATTAAILLYPVLIFLASLRMDKALIVYATFICLLSMNGLYIWFYPLFDPVIAPQIVSADILGQIYRSVYLMLCGMMMYSVPLTMRRILLTQEVLAQESLLHKRSAEQDSLTGIANRRAMEKELAMRMQLAKEINGRIALFFMDLDGFKEINDTLGHEAGDEVLRDIARDISSVIRPCDMVARVGGDEFVILMDHPVNVEDAGCFAVRLQHMVAREVTASDGSLCIAASIGVAMYPEDATEPEKLLRSADEAMYQVKRAGKNGYGFSRPM
jgi:diguanylate cyclase (GGDEF)-like protein